LQNDLRHPGIGNWGVVTVGAQLIGERFEMSDGRDSASDPAEEAPVKASPRAGRAPRAAKAASAGATPEDAAPSAGSDSGGGKGAGRDDDQDSLASAAEHLAMQLGVMPPAGLDRALSAGGRASRTAVRTHRLIVEFHLGQLDRTLRAGRALTACRSFNDALAVHRSFMQDMLRASANHLRELTELGLGAVAGEAPPRRRRG
jgi:hypothetical protein